MTVMAFSGLVFSFHDNTLITQKHALWWVVLFISAARCFDYLIYRIEQRLNKSLGYLLLRFAAGNIAISLVWAFYCIYFFSSMQLIEVATTMVVLSAMAGGAATVLAPSRFLSAFYCTCLLFPMSVQAILTTSQEYKLLGYMGLGFWLAMLLSNRRANHFFTKAVELKENNAELMVQMKQEQAEVTRINAELQYANDALDTNNNNLEVEVKRRTEELYKLSSQDSLTGMLNRSAFKVHMDTKLAEANLRKQTLAVFFIDLDGFKQVNDSLGHGIGDLVLSTIGQRLVEQFPEEQAARWGGDEFVLTIARLDHAQAIALALSIRTTILQPIICHNNRIQLDATIGIALFPEHADTAACLIQKADFAMYQQKKAQSPRVAVYDEHCYADALLAVKRREGLKLAVEKNQLSVAYQPIVDANTHELVCCECLMRWSFNDEQVSPAIFIPLAEQTGFITSLGIWILEQACTEIMALPSLLRPPSISINVSVLQLNNAEFIDHIDRILAATGFNPRRLHFEITESVFAQDKEIIRQRVSEIQSRHIHLSIDDFGTGFSSLSQLQLLSFNYIKIDKSFVLTPSPANEAIVRSTLMLAKEFGCRTVAEGIESNDHATRLHQLGVDYLQGFHFARPMPVNELKVYLQQKR